MSEPKDKKLTIEIVSVIVAVVVILSVLLIYYSPNYSWSNSIRDYDGDGHPDAKDLYPYDSTEWADADGDGIPDSKDSFPQDPEFWGNASAVVAATIVNNYGRDLDYDFHYVYSHSIVDLVKSDTVANGSSVVEIFLPQWATGEVNWTSGYFQLNCHFYDGDLYINPGYSILGPMDLDLSPGETTSVTLTIRNYWGPGETTPALQIPSVTTISSPDGKKCSLTQPTAEATWTD
ncbi:MAG TPA: hypothetical protein VGB78_11435, partial [Thermoplasmata archaeon]